MHCRFEFSRFPDKSNYCTQTFRNSVTHCRYHCVQNFDKFHYLDLEGAKLLIFPLSMNLLKQNKAKLKYSRIVVGIEGLKPPTPGTQNKCLKILDLRCYAITNKYS